MAELPKKIKEDKTGGSKEEKRESDRTGDWTRVNPGLTFILLEVLESKTDNELTIFLLDE